MCHFVWNFKNAQITSRELKATLTQAQTEGPRRSTTTHTQCSNTHTHSATTHTHAQSLNQHVWISNQNRWEQLHLRITIKDISSILLGVKVSDWKKHLCYAVVLETWYVDKCSFKSQMWTTGNLLLHLRGDWGLDVMLNLFKWLCWLGSEERRLMWLET